MMCCIDVPARKYSFNPTSIPPWIRERMKIFQSNHVSLSGNLSMKRATYTHDALLFSITSLGIMVRPSIPRSQFDGQLLINALTGEVGPSTQVTGFPTNQELTKFERRISARAT